ncbi:MAG: carboxypeptidase-like regulatory domain-containing protein [Bacillaceae bacterium]|nr:carboxypeptidase-like regulatory domain-containing protein [Bacillaceae bacterium]
MKIKMKIKHIIIVILTLAILLPFSIIFLQPQLEYTIVDNKLRNFKPVESTRVVNLMEHSKITKHQKLSLIRNYIIERNNGFEYDIVVGPESYQVNHTVMSGRLPEEMRINYLLEYMDKAVIDGYYTNAVRQLTQYYVRNGNVEKAERLILSTVDKLENSSKDYLIEELLVELLFIYVNYSSVEDVQHLIQILEKSAELSSFRLTEITKLEVEKYIKVEDYETAEHVLSKRKSQLEELIRIEIEKYGEEYPISDPFKTLNRLEGTISKGLKEGTINKGKITGTILRSDGTPVSNVAVILRDETNANYGRISHEDEEFLVFTDKNGNYTFTSVMPGSYQVFLGFSVEQIDGWTVGERKSHWIHLESNEQIEYNLSLHRLMEIVSPANDEKLKNDEITFKWEAVPNADYYKINIGYFFEGGSLSKLLQNNIKTEKLTVTSQQLYNKGFGYLFTDSSEWKTTNPISILGLSNPNVRILWTVEAYKNDGTLITRSNGYRLHEQTIGNIPFFYLQERELTEADKLLLDKKWEDAFALYENNYLENSSDLHSLRMLNRLVELEERHTKATSPYRTKLANITKYHEHIFTLVEKYYFEKNWTEFHYWYTKYENAIGNEMDQFAVVMKATALLKQGKLGESREVFEKAMALDGRYFQVGNWIALEILDNETLDEGMEVAIVLAKNYPELSYDEHPETWTYTINKMQLEIRDKNEYHKLLQEGILYAINNDSERLTKWKQKHDYKGMENYIHRLQNIYLNSK